MINDLDESDDYKEFLKQVLELEKRETANSDIKYATEYDRRVAKFLLDHGDD